MSVSSLFVPNHYNLYSNTLTTNNLYLPTSGGTPADLNYYEVYTHVTTFSGPFAAPVAGSFIINRIGNICIARIPEFSAASTTAASISIDTLLPARFRPISVSAVTGTFLALNNSAAALGRYQIVNTGDLIFGVGTTALGNYTNTGNAGIALDNMLVWTIN